jgi:hypothetical protein
MARFFSFSFIILFILLSTVQVTSTSCTKEELVHDTVTKTLHDTVIKVQHDTISRDTALTVQILTANSWKLQEYKGVEGNTNVVYIRGAAGNNVNYDNEYITFNSNGTGGYYDPNYNYTSPLTWNFVNTDNTKLIMTINFPTGAEVVTWDHIIYKNKSLMFDQYWTKGTVNSHTQNIRIPR